MLIGLWVWDELSFDKYHSNYNRIAQVMEQDTYNNNVHTGKAIPLPLYAELRNNYSRDFKHIVITAWTDPHILTAGDKKITYSGTFMGAEGPEMFSLRMLKGTRSGLNGTSGMLISQSVAKALFGNGDPMGKMVQLDNKVSFSVSGVYEDLPLNTTLHGVAFMAPWEFFASNKDWLQRDPLDWSDNSLFIYVQLADNVDIATVSAKIKNLKRNQLSSQASAKLKPELFLQPMAKWHLYAEFKNGVNTGGAIQYVWLCSIIGLFVLLLACINFMNLSTARSEKRAKEVGIRKAIGSLRTQLIIQFYCESVLMAVCAFAIALALVWLALPFFNQLTGKQMAMLWANAWFWLACAGFTLFTGFVAGSYPALYLSSFKPVRVLKGTFKAGRYAATPRKVLVVTQFTVSVMLIVGTITVLRQVQFAKDRPIGYSRDGLLNIEATTSDLHDHFNVLRADLLKSGAITELAESSSPTTGINNTRGDLDWQEKDPSITYDFGSIRVTSAYGKTLGWQFAAGRDFTMQGVGDSSAVVLNETAVKYMGLKNPLGAMIRFRNRDNKVIGIVKDMVMGSPYDPAKPTIYYLSSGGFDDVIMKINPAISAHTAIAKIEAACKTYAPLTPFNYRFVDDLYEQKFKSEERIGRLASIFAVLAVFISCLGLFGMATFMAEQRIKEIGVRKVLGATVLNLWALLSRDFVALVLVALFIAMPLAYYCMHNWLQHYEYRSSMAWWVFVLPGAGAIVITILTVSYQSIKAALLNPVKSLRSE